MRAVVTAGGTREPIDPVRYIGNRSSGKQGYALAAELARRGAQVTLVSTVGLACPPGVEVVAVETAAEMEAAVHGPGRRRRRHRHGRRRGRLPAQGDGRPARSRRRTARPTVVLEPTPDILAGLGARRRPGQVLVGFAAETAGPAGADHLRHYARDKLAAKELDLVVANDVAAPGVGFAHDTNAV